MAPPERQTQALAPPPSHTVSILPAAAVLGIAVVTLFIFGFINFIDSPSTTPTTLPVILGGLAADPSTTVFAGFVEPGTPPSDISSSLIAPTGTTRAATLVTGGGGVGGYDKEVRLSVRAPRANLLGFYRAHLQALGWKLYSTSSAANGGAELLFQKAGSDSWYWEAGVVATSTSARATSYTFRLYQASDVI